MSSSPFKIGDFSTLFIIDVICKIREECTREEKRGGQGRSSMKRNSLTKSQPSPLVLLRMIQKSIALTLQQMIVLFSFSYIYWCAPPPYLCPCAYCVLYMMPIEMERLAWRTHFRYWVGCWCKLPLLLCLLWRQKNKNIVKKGHHLSLWADDVTDFMMHWGTLLDLDSSNNQSFNKIAHWKRSSSDLFLNFHSDRFLSVWWLICQAVQLL